jgi:anti-sigma regulatory factor (Ser/Thr protein kinase)
MRSVRQFSCEADSPAAARHFVKDLLCCQPDGIVEAVELMTSELATNSVRHAHSGFELMIDDSREQIRVEVTDTGQGQPTLRSPTIHERSGRGLRIVQALSDAWGSAPSTDGKMVWFTLSTLAYATERESPSVVSPDEPGGAGHPSIELPGSTDVLKPGSPGDGPSAIGRSGNDRLALRCERHADVAQLAERRSCKAVAPED